MRFEGRAAREQINSSRDNPLKELALLLAALAVLVAGLVWAAGWIAERAMAAIPVAWEVELFGERVNAWFAEDAAVDPSLQPLTDRLTSHWPANPYDIRVRRMEAPAPNALALPGGTVLVTTGLLEQTESENELAFVLAHELGHFRNRDHLRSIGRGLAVKLTLATLAGLAGGDGWSSVSWIEDLASRQFSQGQESDADRFAMELVEAEYGHVAGATDFFKRLPAAESALGRQFERFLSTHPVSADRIEALEDLAAERGWRTEGALTPWASAR